jgi:Domain of unknown function (DUF4942)
MFGIDFYPTPNSVIDLMLANEVVVGKVILEPSAGTGNIVSRLKEFGAKEVIACEIDSSLRTILGRKCNVICNDFMDLGREDVSHIDFIVMNPPFSKCEAHVEHAWEIAPPGCHIISLCNTSMIDNTFSKSREKIREIIKNNGSTELFGRCFNDSERTTDVSISCIRLYKQSDDSDDFGDYFDLGEAESYGSLDNGIMAPNYILDVVSRYVDAVKMFDEVINSNQRMNYLISPIDDYLRISFGAFSKDGNSYNSIDRNYFKKQLQKSAWRTVFRKFDMEKYLTSGVKEKLNKFIEQKEHVPFTMKNIYNMIEMIVGTSEATMNLVLVEAFEKICSFSSENSTAGEGWKTNSDYMLNKRFIKPRVCEYDSRWPRNYVDISSGGANEFDDINKALCYLTGRRYEDYIPLSTYFRYRYKLQREDGTLLGGYDNCFEEIGGFRGATSKKESIEKEQGIKLEIIETPREWGQWVDWGFFRVKGHKKGTMHFEFKDDAVLEMFNRKVAEIKGWRLPKTTKKAYRAKTEGVELFDY